MSCHSAVILAGGRGTRLGLTNKPKIMAEVDGTPLLRRQLEWLRGEGVTQVWLSLGHLADVVIDYLDANPVEGLGVKTVVETEPLGTSGALLQLSEELTGPFWVIYGDLVCDLDLSRITDFHDTAGADLTLVVHPNDHPYDSDLVEVDADGHVTGFLVKPHPAGLMYQNLVSAAVYLATPRLFPFLRNGVDLAREIFPSLLGQLDVRAYETSEYLKDMGTPERLARAEADVVSGKLGQMRLDHPRPAVFLDRDGVICEYVRDLTDPADFQLHPDAASTVRLLNREGYLVLVVTNQPVIAKSMLTAEGLTAVHKKMETDLGTEGAWIDRLYFCPHHPDAGYPGEVVELKVACECRKPQPGMLRQAAEDFRIDVARSFLVGDSPRDIEAATAFGIPAVGMLGGEFNSAESLLAAGAAATFATLTECVHFGLDRHAGH